MNYKEVLILRGLCLFFLIGVLIAAVPACAASPVDLESAQDNADSVAGLSPVKTLNSFDGASGPAYKDHPDTSGGVGPSHVVDFVGAYFIVRDKATGKVLKQQTQAQFWSGLGVKPGTLNDPRIVYDPLSQRWFAVNCGPYIFLAVSSDANPLHAWQAVVVSTIMQGDLLPRVGMDVNGVYICGYGTVNKTNTANCFVAPKADVLWTSTRKISLARLKAFVNLPYELFPATDFNPRKAATDPEIFLTRQGGQNVSSAVPLVLLMKKVTWSGVVPQMSGTITIHTAMMYDTPGSAPQPGPPPIRGVENHRFFNLFGVGSSVFAATGSKINGRVGVVWFEVNASGAIVQQGTIANANYDVLFPTIAADANKNVAIGYTKVSASEFASVYVSSRLAADPAGTLRAPVLLAAGNAAYKCSVNPVGWGTYSSTVVDPSNPLVLWTYQEYSHSTVACHWTTRWVSFSL